MNRTRLFVLTCFMVSTFACSLTSQVAPPTQTSTQPPVLPVTAASATPAAATATAAPTDSPTPALPATVTPFVPATLDPQTATQAAMLGSLGLLMNIRQYFNPIGTPLKIWHNIPILPQATAGQEFTSQLYGYKASVSLQTAQQFYAGKSSAMGFSGTISTGTSGGGDQATHNIDFVSFPLTIVLTSFDNDTGHVIVVISRAP